MMRDLPSLSFFKMSIGIILAIGFCFRAYSAYTNLVWIFWLGNIVVSLLIACTGLLLVLGSATSIKFFHNLLTLGKASAKFTKIERILWVLIGLFLLLNGGYLFLSNIFQNSN